MRTVRNLTPFTKQRISNAMKTHHQQRSETEKQQTAQKQRDGMRQYWSTIPKVSDGQKGQE
jgi:response regulator of citrate/malate metabolism